MPIYEYECTNCGELEEALQKVSDPPLSTCKHCNGQLTKLISHSSFHLKGSGWYVTDYGGSSKKGDKATKTKKNSAPKSSCSSCKPSGTASKKNK